tara:strand:- start:68 stop:349 length:282 start_codon:yes stop_codon:yes gene_type:complete
MTEKPKVSVNRHRMTAGEIRTVLKHHKPTFVWGMKSDDDKIEYLSLHFDLLGVHFTIYSTHNYPWDEDTNVDWGQFIIDARLKGITETHYLSD